MAESSLTLGFPEFLQRVGHLLGWPWDTSTWTAEQLAQGAAVVNDGYRRFLTCSPFQGDRIAHRWSFFEATGTLSVAAADADFDYDAPDDFAAIARPFRFTEAGGGNKPLVQVNEANIEARRALTTQSGVPRLFAVRNKAHTGTGGQRWEFLIWPDADGSYALEYRYEVLDNALSAVRPYALGGMQHSDTILEFCLGAAELFQRQPGTHYAESINRLRASISADLRVASTPSLGMMSDADGEDEGRYGSERRSTVFKYNGVQI